MVWQAEQGTRRPSTSKSLSVTRSPEKPPPAAPAAAAAARSSGRAAWS